MKEYKMDRSFSQAQTLEEAGNDVLFSKDTPIEERLRMSFHLSCTIFGIDPGSSLKIDRTVHSARKFNDK